MITDVLTFTFDDLLLTIFVIVPLVCLVVGAVALVLVVAAIELNEQLKQWWRSVVDIIFARMRADVESTESLHGKE